MENFPKINNVSERKKFEVSFSNALDLIEKTIEENLVRNGADRIVEPFEIRIDKKSITVDDLKRFTRLSIEMFLTHEADGGLVLNTGSRGSTAPDYGNEYRREIELAREIVFSGKKSGDYSDKEKVLVKKLIGYLDNSEPLKERTKGEQDYTAHQHPSTDEKPSIEDIVAFSLSKSKVHFILSKDSISICVATNEMADKAVHFGANSKPPIYGTEKYDNLINELGVMKKVVKFDDPEILLVMQMFRGEASMDVIERLDSVKKLLQ